MRITVSTRGCSRPPEFSLLIFVTQGTSTPVRLAKSTCVYVDESGRAPQRSASDEAIAAGMFGLIEEGIGPFDEILAGHALDTVDSHRANRDGELELNLAEGEIVVLDATAQPLTKQL